MEQMITNLSFLYFFLFYLRIVVWKMFVVKTIWSTLLLAVVRDTGTFIVETLHNRYFAYEQILERDRFMH
jgi:hypothetical protein